MAVTPELAQALEDAALVIRLEGKNDPERIDVKVATQLIALHEENARQVQYKNEAYAERNKLVRLLASLYPSGIKQTAIEGWDEAWHWCVYIDLPSGQASWHFHVDELPLFQGLPPYAGEWDGHTTEQKYEAILAQAYLNSAALQQGKPE